MRQRALPRLALAAAAAAFFIHALANPHYGFFRDELYFIICGRHPALGYVDQPPLVPLISAATQSFGISLFALRLFPALCAAAAVFIACRIVQELEGDDFAQILAAIGTFFAPELLSFGTKVATDTIALWAWPLTALYVIRISKGADPRWWLAAGAALGIAAESKYSVVFFGFALIAALLLSPERRVFFTPWFAAGLLVAALIALPNVLWQAHYGFPMLELLANGAHGKNVILSPVAFLLQQLLVTNPLLSLIWIAGLVWCTMQRPWRWIPLLWAILMAVMIVFHGKMYYPGAVYPVLFAAGAVACANWIQSVPWRAAVAAAALLAGLLLAPVVLPVLPEQTFLSYSKGLRQTLHLGVPQTEHHRSGPLPDDFADMHGWPHSRRPLRAFTIRYLPQIAAWPLSWPRITARPPR